MKKIRNLQFAALAFACWLGGSATGSAQLQFELAAPPVVHDVVVMAGDGQYDGTSVPVTVRLRSTSGAVSSGAVLTRGVPRGGERSTTIAVPAGFGEIDAVIVEVGNDGARLSANVITPAGATLTFGPSLWVKNGSQELAPFLMAGINKCNSAACLCTGIFCADLIDANYCDEFKCAGDQCLCIF